MRFYNHCSIVGKTSPDSPKFISHVFWFPQKGLSKPKNFGILWRGRRGTGTKPGLLIRIRMDPHSFSLLDPDPGGKNLREKTRMNAWTFVVIVILLKQIK